VRRGDRWSLAAWCTGVRLLRRNRTEKMQGTVTIIRVREVSEGVQAW
jgi:hypothetical protein